MIYKAELWLRLNSTLNKVCMEWLCPLENMQHEVLMAESASMSLNYVFSQIIYHCSQALDIQLSRTMINKIYNYMAFENSWHFELSLCG